MEVWNCVDRIVSMAWLSSLLQHTDYVMLSRSQPTDYTLARLCWTVFTDFKIELSKSQRWPSSHIPRKSSLSCMTLSHRISYANFMWHLIQSQHDAIHRWWNPPGRKHLTWGTPKRRDEYEDWIVGHRRRFSTQTLYLFLLLNMSWCFIHNYN